MNIAEYLTDKLEELGIHHYFGLPGDYNLNIIYTIQNNDNLEWIGCTNELNAGYAADGYAREIGYGAVVTTYGVGELSALNALAGSYAENVPVIHIVGMPSSYNLDNNSIGHHSLNDKKTDVFKDIFKNVTEVAAILTKDNAQIEINRILKAFVKTKKPVYIGIPSDLALTEINNKEITIDWYSDTEKLNTVTDRIIEKINNSKHPVLVADELIERFHSKIEFLEFADKSGIPVTNFLMGRNLINKNIKNYLGTYFDSLENTEAYSYFTKSDCPIFVGTLYSDLNSSGRKIPYDIYSKIAIYGTYTYIDGVKYDNIKMADILNNLTKKITNTEYIIEKTENKDSELTIPEGKITYEYLYPRLCEYLNPDDIVYADTGSYTQGLFNLNYKDNVKIQSQISWNSIGWATPAAFGAGIAKRDNNIIIITGDGAHQITAMEIGSMLRNNLKPVIIVINNNGYTLERILSDKFDNDLNNINKVDYAKLARSFNGEIWSTKVDTADDFDKALRVTKIMKKLCYIEVMMDYDNIPQITKEFINTKQDDDKSQKPVQQNTATKKKMADFKLLSNFGTTTHKSLKDIENGD